VKGGRGLQRHGLPDQDLGGIGSAGLQRNGAKRMQGVRMARACSEDLEIECFRLRQLASHVQALTLLEQDFDVLRPLAHAPGVAPDQAEG
jgi:hypothetical protein